MAILRNCGRFGALASALLLGSCREMGYRPDDEFVNSYVELKLASAALSADPVRANEIRRAILAQRGMTPAEFHAHFVRLTDHPEAWKSFQERVVERIDAFQKERKGESHVP